MTAPREPAASSFVGRTAELERAEGLLRRARGGSPRPLLVVGEAGSGTSTFLRHVVGLARRSGFRDLVIDGDVIDGDVPYAALRLALAGLDGDAVVADPRPALAAIGAASAASPAVDADGGSAVGDALVELLEAMTFRCPVVVAIDNLHALDPGTAHVVDQLTSRLRDVRVLVLATGRRGEPSTALAVDRRTEVVELGGLCRAELDELAAQILGDRLDGSSLDVLHDVTGGLPFFATELLGAVADSPLIRQSLAAEAQPIEADASLPSRVVAAVLHNIERLGEDSRRVAAAVAVIGEVPRPPRPIVAALTELSPERVESALLRLVEGRVLDARGGRYTFRHALVRTALYCDVGPATRQRWHGAIAEQLELRHGSWDAETHLAVAAHVRRAAPQPSSGAAELLRTAGDLVVDHDPTAAAGWYRDALARLRPDDRTVPDTQLRLSRALDLGGEHDEAARIAASVVRAAAPGPARARAAVTAAHARLALGELGRAAELLDATLRERSTRSTELVLHRAVVHLWEGRPAPARRCLDEALARGGRQDRWLADVVEMHLAVGAGRFRRGAALGERIRSGIDRCPPGERALALLHVAVVSAVELAPAVALDIAAQSTDRSPMAPCFRAVAAYARFRQGHLADSAQLATSQGVGDGSGHLLRALDIARLVAGTAERGDLSAAEAAARADASGVPPPLRSVIDTAVAHLHLVRGDHRSAVTVLAAAESIATVGAPGIRAGALAGLIDAHLAAGERDAARAVNHRLQAIPSDDAAIAVTMHQLLSRALVDRDLEAARQARRHAADHGLELDAARSLGVIGALADDPGTLLDAYRELGALGAEFQQRAVATELRRRGRRVPSGLSSAGSLTPVERDVAALVAQGLTNRQVATRTNLSAKTVEVYLSRIYGKTGVRTRVELAVALNAGRLDENLTHA